MTVFLARPFFIYTPRNVFGEALSACPLAIRCAGNARVELKVPTKGYNGKVHHEEDWQKARKLCDKKNYEYETNQAYAAHI